MFTNFADIHEYGTKPFDFATPKSKNSRLSDLARIIPRFGGKGFSRGARVIGQGPFIRQKIEVYPGNLSHFGLISA
jgi:hypothetical protein